MKPNNSPYTDQFYGGNNGPSQSSGFGSAQPSTSSNSSNSGFGYAQPPGSAQPSESNSQQGNSGAKQENNGSLVTLPKGGGAIKGIGEKFEANPLTGTASITVPITLSKGRNEFTPQLALSYDSGSGNSPFGLGWNIGIPSITRKTDKGIPQYKRFNKDNPADMDTFILSGAEDLVPVLEIPANGEPYVKTHSATLNAQSYTVATYRPRTEGLFAKIELWINDSNNDMHWRATTKDNVTSVYGQSSSARITNPQNDSHVFQWLLERNCDNKGNIALYTYKQENSDNIPKEIYDRHRLDTQNAYAKRYLKSVKYGNTTMAGIDDNLSTMNWLFQLVADYGEHTAATLSPTENTEWAVRTDPFSSYKSGFEIRTWRLCKRLLMFHNFSELGSSWTLVRATEMSYNTDELLPGEALPALTLLNGVTHHGYRDGTSESYPPVRFSYSEALAPQQILSLDEESMENLTTPPGMSSQVQWIDLHNEGVTGALIKQPDAWYYKPGLGDQSWFDETLTAPSAGFGKLQKLKELPSIDDFSFGDLDGNGKTDITIHQNGLHGFQEIDEKEWSRFTPFHDVPNINFNDPNLRMLDLTGDGHADILITEDRCFTCYFSKAKEGYEPARRVSKAFDENKGPALVFHDRTQQIFTADMSGDGMTDIVRVRNGSVDYWPNMGYGRFGVKVSMKNAPRFDYPGAFDPGRIKLADIDGTGTADILYIGKTTSAWYNMAGNQWSEEQMISLMPPCDTNTSVAITDLMGKGTSCIVWSSSNPSAHHAPIRYMELTGGKKPFLMEEMNNNMGGVRKFSYLPSTKFYLEDKNNGTPWATKLSFPVHVLVETETIDEPTNTSYVNKYAYHHGYFDGKEREFRGFGMVEQWDCDDYELDDEDLSPVYTKTWFHTGAFADRKMLEEHYKTEYFSGDTSAWLLPDTTLPAGLNSQERHEACRVLRGSVLRREVYAIDATDKQDIPYTVEEKSYSIKLIQNKLNNKHAVLRVQEEETISYNYERMVDDPRIAHKIMVESDAYGNITKEAQVAYPRRTVPTELPEQGVMWVSYTERNFINEPNSSSFYRIGVPYEEKLYQIHGLPFDGTTKLEKEIQDNITTATEINFEATYSGTGVEKQIQAHSRSYFYSEDLNTKLALGSIASHGLPWNNETLAYTQTFITHFKNENINGAGYHNDLLAGPGLWATLRDEGLYNVDGTSLWQPSQRQTFDATKFFLPVSSIDPMGNTTTISYDSHNLLIDTVTDALNYDTSVENDYYTLQPKEITDPNLNHTEVAFDALGMVTATAMKGKETSPGVWEGDTIADPTVSMDYDLHCWMDENDPQPVVVHTQAREEHKNASTGWLHSYAYSDGLGRELQTKVQAEDGPAWTLNESYEALQVPYCTDRWVATGRTIYNNKGKVVKQYEPWFSTTHEYVKEAELTEYGVTPVMFYDPVGRLVKTELPDGNHTKVEFDAWKQKNYDQNDTNDTTDHYNTPQVQHYDPLGRLFLTVDDNGTEGTVETRQQFDIKGNPVKVKDALGRWMTEQIYNIAGEPVYTFNIDSGRRWMLNNAAGNPLRMWNNRDHELQMEYDAMNRPTARLLVSSQGTDKLEKTTYGTSSSNNNIGQVAEQCDQSGKNVISSYDFKGNALSLTKHLCLDYQNTIDWNGNPTLETETFTQSFTFDAMNRPVTHTKADRTIEQYGYNKAGLLETLSANVRGATSPTNFVTNIDYNEKGQRLDIYYGNGSKTKYVYDPLTFRLTRLLTTRNTGADILQDLNYTYDPVGNITQITDNAQQTHYFGNTVVSPTGTYTYDALYRLKTATGRELSSLAMSNQTDFVNTIGMPNSASNAMQNYTQQFAYDELGNIQSMSSQGQWTRNYFYNSGDNYLLGHTSGTTEYTYDAHGNITSMPHINVMGYDQDDQLRAAIFPSAGVFTYYCYDSTGNRTRKVVQKPGNIIEDHIYLGGYEVYRKTINGTLNFERETLSISDDQKAIVRIETKTVENGSTISSPVSNQRYQYDNHLGSACLELDSSAAIISYEEYHPFGTTSYRAGSSQTEVSLKRYKYCGKERDEETGLYYYGARYYAAWIGRFVSVDPLQFKYPHYTPYQYAGNKPISYIDLDGLEEAIFDSNNKRIFDGTLKNNSLKKSSIDDTGFINDVKVTKNHILELEKGEMNSINAIVLHRTNSGGTNNDPSGSGSVLNSFESGIGTHFLIDLSGNIYQTASLKKYTYHVGKIKSRCFEEGECSADDTRAIINIGWNPTKLDKHEQLKDYPDRYPKSFDSIGIEVVGKYNPKSDSWDMLTEKQLSSVNYLIDLLISEYELDFEDDIYTHEGISYKTKGEGQTVLNAIIYIKTIKIDL